ncbi:hypothetical protein KP509_36G039500 [Ceratopteris richardii]|uniref:NADH dehydrogenase [ubiquinone] 1 alpha subcomplex subunit 5 n=1 Tax=Ceratopteris richardii TaxID=49495 RepID=A0A8T2QDM6_CERRI|nr:hypothetical protein KP509_36G039500 [Ceratopteris richardii]
MFLRRFAGPLLGKVKESTGLVGLEVVPNAREVLIKLYKETLESVEDIPTYAEYRKAVEKFTRFRLKVCEEEQEWEKIEQRINGGQVEELIVMAKDELMLMDKMKEWKPWEVPEDHKIEIIQDDTPIPAHVPRHRSLFTLDPFVPPPKEEVERENERLRKRAEEKTKIGAQ